MADKTVTYRLLADITAFRAQMAQAAESVKVTADRMTAATSEGRKFRAGLTTVGSTAGKIGLVAAAGLGAAVAAAANFDQAMSRVQGATQDSAKQMELLRTAAINAGRDTVFSASEAAAAEEEMAKAGVKTKDILSGGLTGALNLASAGTIGVGQAAEIAATTMNQFGLAGSQVTHIADVLAATAGKAQGEVTDMAEALKYVGPVASQMGVSLEQTAGSIGYLASQGILGSQAGTSLRGILTALTSPSKAAAKEMKTLGISMYDAKGNFVGLDGIAGQLHKTMSGLTNAQRDQALGVMFGNQQITAARILYAGGAQAVDQWTKKVNDSGYAARLAATKMDNLKGDLEQLKGSLETALIGTGEGAQTPLRSLVQNLTSAVNAYSNLGDGAKQGVAKALGATALLGGSIYVFSRLVTGISATRVALKELGVTSVGTSAALKTAGWVGLAVALDQGRSHLADWARGFDDAAPSVTTLTADLQVFKRSGDLSFLSADVQGMPQLFSDLTSRVGNAAQETQGFLGSVPLLGRSLVDQIDFVDQATGHHVSNLRTAQKTISNLDASLANIASQSPAAARQMFGPIAAEARAAGVSMKDLMRLFPEYFALIGKSRKGKLAEIDLAQLQNGLTSLRDYKSELAKLPSKVLTQVLNPGALTSTKQVEALAKQYKLTPKQIQTIMRARDFAGPQIQKVLKDLKMLDHTHTNPKIGADNKLATDRYRVTKAQLIELGHAHPMSTLDANFHPAATAIQAAMRNLGIYDKQHPSATLDANPVPALQAIARTQQAINSLHGTTVTNYVTTVHRGGAQTAQADGSVLDFYAAGGIREHHVAQIAPAGAMRIWAEPETGGEAYIPLAPAKRDRSRAIASEVVARLGGTVQFAHGGIMSVRSEASGGTVVRIEGPLAIKGRLDLNTGQLMNATLQVVRQELDDASSFSRTESRR